MNDLGLLNGPATDRNVRPFRRKVTQPSLPISRRNHPRGLSPEQDAFLHDRFSTTLKDPGTGRRIK